MLQIDQKIISIAKKGIRNCPFNFFLFQKNIQKENISAQNVLRINQNI